jgi:hypothetical protein
VNLGKLLYFTGQKTAGRVIMDSIHVQPYAYGKEGLLE